jgi:hypothetical protein
MLHRRNRASVAQTTQNWKCYELASGRQRLPGTGSRRPSPRVFVMRHAGAERGRADAHVAAKDVPAFVGGIEIAAAGNRGHAAIKARQGRAGHQSAGEITFRSRAGGYFVPVRNIPQCE